MSSQVNENPGPSFGGELTVEQFAGYLAPRVWAEDHFLTWPPDVFALVAAILVKSGAYTHAVERWNRSSSGLKPWVDKIRGLGLQWRDDPAQPPAEVVELHRKLIQKRDKPVFNICDDEELCGTLLELSAVADEACAGVGCTLLSSATGTAKEEMPAFLEDASKRLFETWVRFNVSTLCKQVSHSTVRVLPKLHTPQSGLTMRSLTHHVALCPAGDVRAKWAECIPKEKRHCLNLLLAPWPLNVAPAHFTSVPTSRAQLRDMPKGFGFFEYNPPGANHQSAELIAKLMQMLTNARSTVTKIDGVVFPELALTHAEYQQISDYLMPEGVFLICGVRGPVNEKSRAARNYLHFDVPFPGKPLICPQDKHHRWRLDKRQIVQYGLGSCLDVASNWWEHISIGSRELHFVVLDDWLTVCPLICEDLARQDPISELVRAVGPNLVIALLMDGPQLSSRWPARYATVLADDPGSSVLTLTSVGMAELSRPPNVHTGSRAVALWKDASGEAVSIELPPNMEGVILSLSRKLVWEYSADGRDDGGMTGYPTLSGIHYVRS